MKKLIDPKNKSETVLPDARAEKARKCPKFRDINEDDDGYHPYSDRPETSPLFEEDPWR